MCKDRYRGMFGARWRRMWRVISSVFVVKVVEQGRQEVIVGEKDRMVK